MVPFGLIRGSVMASFLPGMLFDLGQNLARFHTQGKPSRAARVH
jgi:hypothetical protein